MERATEHDASASVAPRWQRPSALEVLTSSLIPIVGVVWFGWSGFTLLLIYWVESAVAGVFNVLRMLLARPEYENMAEQIVADRWMLKRYPISDAQWQLARETPAPIYSSYKQLLVPLFVGHYSLFLAVQGVLLVWLIRGAPPQEWFKAIRGEWTLGVTLAVVVVTVQYAWRFWREDLEGRCYTKSFPFLALFRPYRQVLDMQLAIFLGGLAIVFTSLPATVAVLLVGIKAAFELNWLRLPIGPTKIDWLDVIEHASAEDAGTIDDTSLREQPEESNVVLEHDANLIRFVVPERGIVDVWRRMQAGGCLVVGLIFLGVCGVMGFGFVSPLFRAGRFVDIDMGTYWGVLLYLGVAMAMATVWLVVLSLMTWTLWEVITFGCRRATVVLDHEALEITQRTLLRTRRQRLPREQIVELGPSPTGDATNQFRVYQLRIRLRDGSQTAFLAGRDEYELAWMATVLRDELGKN